MMWCRASCYAKRFVSRKYCDKPFLLSDRNVQQVHQYIIKWMEFCNVSEAPLSSRYIISHALKIGYRKSAFDDHLKNIPTSDQLRHVVSMVKRRIQHEPLQYILGNWDFYGLELECQSPVLIPRPETEELVSKVLTTDILQTTQSPHILDIGAGTGAIGLALLSQLPHAKCTAIDIDEAAVSLAQRNAMKLHLNSRYTCLHAAIQQFNPTSSFDIIVSNPPYIPSDEMKSLQREVQFESTIALEGGVTGLDIIKDIIIAAPQLLSPSGSREIWMEVHASHPDRIHEVVDEIDNGIEVVSVDSDMFKLPRFVRLRAT